MFGKYQNVFRSRWKALMWAGGVLLTAYCTVPSPDDEDSEIAAIAGIAAPAPEPTPEPTHEANPWALDPPRPAG